jgi:hypothetical protein
MSAFKILSYEATPSIQNQRGLITVMLSDTWCATFKVVNKADGGFFIAPATVKGEPDEDGNARWRDGVSPDSKTLRDEFYAALRDFVKEQQKDSNELPF